VGIWANKGNRTTFLVDSETKQATPYLVEGYINGQNGEDGKKKWLSNDEIKAIHDASGNAGNPWVIGAGNQPFWGNVIIDAKAGKTYWLFQGNSQIGFQQYTFYPGKSKEDVTSVETIKTVAEKANGARYNLAGQKVDSAYKGVVIQNGRKMLVK
jgi:hypothetical protein